MSNAGVAVDGQARRAPTCPSRPRASPRTTRPASRGRSRVGRTAAGAGGSRPRDHTARRAHASGEVSSSSVGGAVVGVSASEGSVGRTVGPVCRPRLGVRRRGRRGGGGVEETEARRARPARTQARMWAALAALRRARSAFRLESDIGLARVHHNRALVLLLSSSRVASATSDRLDVAVKHPHQPPSQPGRSLDHDDRPRGELTHERARRRRGARLRECGIECGLCVVGCGWK